MRRLRDRAITVILWVAFVTYGIVLVVVTDAALDEAYPPIEPGYAVVNEDDPTRYCYAVHHDAANAAVGDQPWSCYLEADRHIPEDLGYTPVWIGPESDLSDGNYDAGWSR